MRIFISHINEEAKVASVLKKWLESIFQSQVAVFVSSDSDDIPACSKWFEQIDSALKESELLIVLCSRKSISRPWINFDAGCGWIRRIPIIPICYSGMTKDSLPTPLSMLQGINAHEQDFSTKLLDSIASHLGVIQTHQINTEAFDYAIQNAISTVGKTEQGFNEKKSKKTEGVNALQDIEIEILKTLALGDDQRFTVNLLATILKIPLQKAGYYLVKMAENELIQDILAIDSPTTYMLDQAGRKYLIENGLL